MKKLNLLLVFCLAMLTFVQAQIPPQAFNYSAVARNAAGQPIATATIGIQVSILKTSPTGVAQYSENHFVNTDAFGLFNLVIGGGAVQSGSMTTIDWSNDNYYLKVGMDATGGTNFLTMGTTQLLSVPYALHAKTAESIVGGGAGFSGNYNDLTNLPITVTSISSNGDTLLLSNGQSFVSASSSSSLPSITTDNVIQTPCSFANSGGFDVASTVVNDGGETIIRRGICFGTNSNLTTSNSLTVDDGTYGTNGGSLVGADTTMITGLLSGTQYYFRSFAVNVKGTSYGQVISYTTPVVTLPNINTLPTTNISVSSATLNADLIDFGNDPCSLSNQFGVCYGTSPNPTTNNTVSYNSPSTNVQGLQPNTTYYVRAFATNSIGTSYGNQVTFTTQQVTLPVVTTQQVTNITSTDADITGLIISAGNADCAHGFVISMNPNPTSNDFGISESGSLSGSYTINTSQQVGLDPNTTYYVRAFVLSDCQGASVYTYGNEISFTTLP
jgi:hypothetical protein